MARERSELRDTIPYGTHPRWFRDDAGAGLGIVYSPMDAPVDEVGVLAGTVLARGGVLRGLMRNHSRTLWAYGVTVTAGGREWRWPLSMQPGEAAPFEIDDWDGPADPADISFEIDAEMSNDADMTRDAWVTLTDVFPGGLIEEEDFGYFIPSEVSVELDPRGAVILDLRLGGSSFAAYSRDDVVVSHPGSVHYWNLPRTAVAWTAWVAWIPRDQARVVEVDQLALFHSRRWDEHEDGSATLIEAHILQARPYPELEVGRFNPRVAFNPTALTAPDTQSGHIVWVGTPHPPSH